MMMTKAQRAEYNRKYWERLKADPIRHAKHLEKRREKEKYKPEEYDPEYRRSVYQSIKDDPERFTRYKETTRRYNQKKWKRLKNDPERYTEQLKKQRSPVAKSQRKLKVEVFTAYSSGPPRCACCDITELDFLTLDHINGRSVKEQRYKAQFVGRVLYRRLRKEGYPPGYQVLCWNCNAAKGIFGGCPHQRERTVLTV